MLHALLGLLLTGAHAADPCDDVQLSTDAEGVQTVMAFGMIQTDTGWSHEWSIKGTADAPTLVVRLLLDGHLSGKLPEAHPVTLTLADDTVLELTASAAVEPVLESVPSWNFTTYALPLLPDGPSRRALGASPMVKIDSPIPGSPLSWKVEGKGPAAIAETFACLVHVAPPPVPVAPDEDGDTDAATPVEGAASPEDEGAPQTDAPTAPDEAPAEPAPAEATPPSDG